MTDADLEVCQLRSASSSCAPCESTGVHDLRQKLHTFSERPRRTSPTEETDAEVVPAVRLVRSGNPNGPGHALPKQHAIPICVPRRVWARPSRNTLSWALSTGPHFWYPQPAFEPGRARKRPGTGSGDAHDDVRGVTFRWLLADRRTPAKVRDAGHSNESTTSGYLHVVVEDDEFVWLEIPSCTARECIKEVAVSQRKTLRCSSGKSGHLAENTVRAASLLRLSREKGKYVA